MDPFVPVSADIESPQKRSNFGKKYDKNYYTLTRKDNNFASRYERNYNGGEQMKHLEDEIIVSNHMEEEDEKPRPEYLQSFGRSKVGITQALNLDELEVPNPDEDQPRGPVGANPWSPTAQVEAPPPFGGRKASTKEQVPTHRTANASKDCPWQPAPKREMTLPAHRQLEELGGLREEIQIAEDFPQAYEEITRQQRANAQREGMTITGVLSSIHEAQKNSADRSKR